MAKSRRNFLKTAAAGAAAFVAKPGIEEAQQAEAPVAEARVIDRPGSDFMLDVFKSIGFEYLFANPGGSFGRLHESVINYGNNKDPEFEASSRFCMRERLTRRSAEEATPLLSRGGVDATSIKCREATFERSGRGGAGQTKYGVVDQHHS